MPLPGVESMKPKGYMLRHLGPGQLRVRGCVQYEQKRSVLASIEHDREDDAFVFISCAWCRHKHWLSRITPVLVPGTRGLCAYIDFDQLIEKVTRVLFVDVDTIGKLVVTGVSVKATKLSPILLILTLALLPNSEGENAEVTRLKMERQGSVANSA